MKLIMYGTEICSDCVEAKTILASHPEVEVDYKDITKDTKTLKEFLAIRDSEEQFQPVKAAGGIGIPFFIGEDGKKSFELSEYLEDAAMPQGTGCSIDGTGC